MKKWCLLLFLPIVAGCGSYSIKPSLESSVEGKWYGKSTITDEDFATLTEGKEEYIVENIKATIASENCDLTLNEDGTYELWGKWLLREKGTWAIFAGQVMITPVEKLDSTSHAAVFIDVADPDVIGISIDDNGELSTGQLVTRSEYRMVFIREQFPDD